MSHANALSALVRRFVADVTEMARLAAKDALANALPLVTGDREISTRRPLKPFEHGPRLVSYLLAEPGSRAPEIRRHLDVDGPTFRAVVRRHARDGLIRFEGNTRARKYFAVDTATTRHPTSNRRQPARRV
jgi:hypothetical protein